MTGQTLNDIQFFGFGYEGYKISDQLPKVSDGNIMYFGFVNRNGNWYIFEQNTNDGVGTYRYIKGDSGYTTAWSGREALIFDYFYNIFK